MWNQLVRQQSIRRTVFVAVLISISLFVSYGQEHSAGDSDLHHLPAYYKLNTDADRMRFLLKTINDSLYGDKLANIYAWAKRGASLAKKNGVDSMQGSFTMNMGKWQYFYNDNVDSAIFYYKKSITYFKNPLHEDRITAIRNIMDAYADLGNKDSAFVYLNAGLAIMVALPDTSYIKYRLAEMIGTNYSWFGLFKSAVRMFELARSGYLSLKKYQGVGMVLSHIALVHDELEEDTRAIQFWKESLPYLAETRRPYSINCSNIASSFCDLGQYDSARVYLEKSNALAKDINLMKIIWSNQRILGNILTGEKKYAEARKIYDKCLVYFEKDAPRSVIMCLFDISNLDSSTNNIPAAVQSLERALQLSREAHLQPEEAKALQGLSHLSAITGNYKNAWQYENRYTAVKDSLTKEKMATDLADFEIVYKTQQKEQQIHLLKSDNDLKSLQLQSSRRSIIFYIVAFVMALIIVGVTFYQRNLRNKIEAQKTKAELETKVLRLQMNPHFIFNSLNSIENFIMRNEKRLASDYLNKFARLIRMILDSTRMDLVSVAKDMEALQLYIDLEQLRFNNKFSYKAYIDPVLLAGDYRAPSLLIQPYVENAIVHGLAHSDEEGLYLVVTATLENDSIKYIIQDNGVGREKSREYNRQNKPYHESIGLKITEERIHIFNNKIDGHGAVKITDLYDENNVSDGTKVEITINAV